MLSSKEAIIGIGYLFRAALDEHDEAGYGEVLLTSAMMAKPSSQNQALSSVEKAYTLGDLQETAQVRGFAAFSLVAGWLNAAMSERFTHSQAEPPPYSPFILSLV